MDLNAFAPPENLPFSEHVARIVSGELDARFWPTTERKMRQSSARRAHAPELFVNALAAKEHLPFAEFAAERQPVNESPQFAAERSPGKWTQQLKS